MEVLALSPGAISFWVILVITMAYFVVAFIWGRKVIRESYFRKGFIEGKRRARIKQRKYAHDYAIGRAKGLAEVKDWYNRKTDAEARGEPFDEPPPWERDTNASRALRKTANRHLNNIDNQKTITNSTDRYTEVAK